MIQEINREVSSGYVALVALFLATAIGIFALVKAIQVESVVQIVVISVVLTAIMVAWAGLRGFETASSQRVFVIRISSFFRHSSLGIRHSGSEDTRKLDDRSFTAFRCFGRQGVVPASRTG